ncbi:YxiJ family protein [Lysinibacillus sp. NPDC092081]|uniref:YxiJ family protein n=1 Tax=Lysinibacillus sp. NPDC092081 TaxID=3364131 RepID=UPI003821EAF1
MTYLKRGGIYIPILKQLTEIKSELENPFPYRDTDKIQNDFRTEFLKLRDEKNCLPGDFNTYCMNIAGTLSYVLADKINSIPQNQIEVLHKSFFNFYKQYRFFESKVEDYNDFFQEYKTFEQTRKLLLDLLSK